MGVALERDAAGEMVKPKIEYVTHAEGGQQGMMSTFRARPEDLVYSHGHVGPSRTSQLAATPRPTSARRTTRERPRKEGQPAA